MVDVGCVTDVHSSSTNGSPPKTNRDEPLCEIENRLVEVPLPSVHARLARRGSFVPVSVEPTSTNWPLRWYTSLVPHSSQLLHQEFTRTSPHLMCSLS